MPTYRRLSCHFVLAQLILLPCVYRFVTSSEDVIDSGKDEKNDISERPVEPYYFSHEVNFLAKQAMLLGDYNSGPAKKVTMTDIVDNDEVTRLRFIEKSLEIELDYIRRLKAMMKKGTHDETTIAPPIESVAIQYDKKVKNNQMCVPDIINSTISGATWPTWATMDYSKGGRDFPEIHKIDHKFDYDWQMEKGFGYMHKELECTKQALNQKKPMYTPEMWTKLWETFRTSSLFPFPIPTEEERIRKPFYVDFTTDSKGRGNFASRDIPKGSLVNTGQPTTAFFLDNKSWFRFVSELPSMMACDVMEWAWQQDLTETGNVVLCLNLDEAVFFNDGGWDGSTNMEIQEKTSLDFYTIRDIKKGEELVYEYDQFDFDTEEMDL